MRDPQSERIVETLLQSRERAVKIFRENYQEIVEPYRDKLMQYSQEHNTGILEALYEVLKPKDRHELPLGQTEKTLYSAAAVDILNAQKDSQVRH